MLKIVSVSSVVKNSAPPAANCTAAHFCGTATDAAAPSGHTGFHKVWDTT